MGDDRNESSAHLSKAHRTKIRPCLNCRQRHLKCNYETEICHRCEKDNLSCQRIQSKAKFRKFAVDARAPFSKEQTWIRTADKLQYVDETAITAATNGHLDYEASETRGFATDSNHVDGDDVELAQNLAPAQRSLSVNPTMPSNQNHHLSHQLSDGPPIDTLHAVDEVSISGDVVYSNTEDLTPRGFQSSKARHLHDQISSPAWSRSGTALLIDDASQAASDLDRAILLRYFVQEVACWFDICDPERHFTQVVPHRARSSPVLLNAICTASARHLARLPKYRNSDGCVEWGGLRLPHINQDTALEFHNECIRDLLRLSMDPDQVRNVDLLAASIILRTDEEIDAPFLEGKVSREVFLQVASVFMDAQTPSTAAVPHSSPVAYYTVPSSGSEAFCLSSGYSPTSNIDVHSEQQVVHSIESPSAISIFSPSSDVHSEGLRQACFWIALRQELHASFMAQRAFNFQLSKFDSFRNHSRASDAVWADRVVVHHAAVLEYCYSHPPHNGDSRKRWTELKQESDRMQTLLPRTFQPIFQHEKGRHHHSNHHHDFPEIWFLDNCHVAAAAYFELTGLLLASFDPRRPKFGNGYTASQREVTKISKSACWKLCGMALSNKQAPPIFLNACAAVALCGDYFIDDDDDESQRRALLWFLNTAEEETGLPTSELSRKLNEAWTDT